MKIGDKIELNFSINNESKTESFIIASLVSYPNYVFLFKDGASTVSEPEDFAVVEINEEHFKFNPPANPYFTIKPIMLPYNSIYIKYKDNVNKVNIENLIRIKLKEKIFYFTDREQSVNYVNYEQTLLQIDSFSYICPSILLLMAILLLYIIQRRNVAVETKANRNNESDWFNGCVNNVYVYKIFFFSFVFWNIISLYIYKNNFAFNI